MRRITHDQENHRRIHAGPYRPCREPREASLESSTGSDSQRRMTSLVLGKRGRQESENGQHDNSKPARSADNVAARHILPSQQAIAVSDFQSISTDVVYPEVHQGRTAKRLRLACQPAVSTVSNGTSRDRPSAQIRTSYAVPSER